MKRIKLSLTVCVIFIIASMSGLCSSQIILPSEHQYVTINFNFIFIDMNGNPTTELYSGGWFSYNITITNESGSDLNTTYTVSVYNPDNSVNGYPRDFKLNLRPNQSGCLYPNNTFNAPTNISINASNTVDAHFADTVGAYKVNVTASTPITYLRLSNNKSTYNFMFNYYQICFDAMPSYQERLNEQASDFYQKNQQYFEDYQRNTNQANADSIQIQRLTIITVIVSVLALVMSQYSIPKDERWSKKTTILYTVISGTIALLIIAFSDFYWFAFIGFVVFNTCIMIKFFSVNRSEMRKDELDKVAQKEYIT